MNMKLPGMLALAVMAVASNQSFAASDKMDTQQGRGMQTQRHGPPKEAVDACAGKQNGAACTFTAPHGAMTGTCRVVPEGKMACVPPKGMEPPNDPSAGPKQGKPVSSRPMP